MLGGSRAARREIESPRAVQMAATNVTNSERSGCPESTRTGAGHAPLLLLDGKDSKEVLKAAKYTTDL